MSQTKPKKPRARKPSGEEYDALVELLILNGAAKGLAGSVATAMLCECCRKPFFPVPSGLFLSCGSGLGKLVPATVAIAEIVGPGGKADLIRPDELWKMFRSKTNLSKAGLLRGQEPPKPAEK